MSEKYTSLGLMSGTSGDGVDASIINSDGINEFETIKDKYFEYDSNIYKDFHFLKDRSHRCPASFWVLRRDNPRLNYEKKRSFH